MAVGLKGTSWELGNGEGDCFDWAVAGADS